MRRLFDGTAIELLGEKFRSQQSDGFEIEERQLPNAMSKTTTRSSSGHHRGLLFIAGYAFLKALLFIAAGIGALHFLNRDLADTLGDWVHDLRWLDPNSHLINSLIEHASDVTKSQLRNFSIVVFSYAALNLLEAIGLYLEKAWAEYLTLIITGSFLPLELYELIHKQSMFRASLLVANLLIFVYLFAIIALKRRK